MTLQRTAAVCCLSHRYVSVRQCVSPPLSLCIQEQHPLSYDSLVCPFRREPLPLLCDWSQTPAHPAPWGRFWNGSCQSPPGRWLENQGQQCPGGEPPTGSEWLLMDSAALQSNPGFCRRSTHSWINEQETQDFTYLLYLCIYLSSGWYESNNQYFHLIGWTRTAHKTSSMPWKHQKCSSLLFCSDWNHI